MISKFEQTRIGTIMNANRLDTPYRGKTKAGDSISEANLCLGSNLITTKLSDIGVNQIKKNTILWVQTITEVSQMSSLMFIVED